MADLDPLQQRYAFQPPAIYGELIDVGAMDPHHAHHLQFADLIWLTPQQSADWVFPPNQIRGLVPFARTNEDDLWCWYPALTPAAQAVPVVFCPDEDEIAVRYAADFASFCYRRMLEEYACTGLTEHVSSERSQVVLDEYRQLLQPFFQPAWNERLAALAQLEWQSDHNGYYGCIDEDQLAELVAVDLDDADIDQEFEHFIE